MARRFELAESDVDEDGTVCVEIALQLEDPSEVRRIRELFAELVRPTRPNLEAVKKGKD